MFARPTAVPLRPRDPLTGLASCHGFLLDLQQAIAGAALPLALVVIEPRVREPHAQRGARLATVGRLLALASGRDSRVTRLDARRFAVLLPRRELAAAAAIAARLADAVHVFFDASASVSVCAGVAATPEGFDGAAEALIDLAVWRCEAARLRGLPLCASNGPSGELQHWPALAEPALDWSASADGAPTPCAGVDALSGAA